MTERQIQTKPLQLALAPAARARRLRVDDGLCGSAQQVQSRYACRHCGLFSGGAGRREWTARTTRVLRVLRVLEEGSALPATLLHDAHTQWEYNNGLVVALVVLLLHRRRQGQNQGEGLRTHLREAQLDGIASRDEHELFQRQAHLAVAQPPHLRPAALRALVSSGRWHGGGSQTRLAPCLAHSCAQLCQASSQPCARSSLFQPPCACAPSMCVQATAPSARRRSEAECAARRVGGGERGPRRRRE